MELKAGDVVAERFRLDRELGRGGMGAVWRAHHLALNAPCAVKFIDRTLADREDLVVRFQREAQAAAQIRSPNVVQILDFGLHGQLPYIAMELLEGEDLAARLARARRLSAEATLRIVEGVARALSKAHKRGIVHRDLKPENVFLAMDEGTEIPKVLDFGIAKDTGAVIESTTQSGVLMGTPFYMSPEQARGERNVDARSDLWSLGVVTFQCLTGELPFTGNNLGDLLAKVILGETPLPSQLDARLPAALDDWWRRAVARKPEDRFQDALDMAAQLARALGRSPIADRVSMPSYTEVAAVSAPTLQSARHETSTGGPISRTLGAGRRSRSPLLVGMAAGGVTLTLIAVGIALSWSRLSPSSEPEPVATADPVPRPAKAPAPEATAAAPPSSAATGDAGATPTEPTAEVTKPPRTRPKPTVAKPPATAQPKPAAPTPKPTPAPKPASTQKKIDFGI